MASPTVNTSTGSSITFATGFFAQILECSWDGITVPSIDTTHFGSSAGNGTNTFGGRTFMAGDLADPGSLKVKIHFNPDTAIPVHLAAASLTLTIAGSATPATWACSAFFTDFGFSMPLEDKMVADCTLKFSGVLTKTSGT